MNMTSKIHFIPILITAFFFAVSCNKPEGCKDYKASNYNSEAIREDGSCIYISGCTDPTANNYDKKAVIDDGSCKTFSMKLNGQQSKKYILSNFTIVKISSNYFIEGSTSQNEFLFKLRLPTTELYSGYTYDVSYVSAVLTRMSDNTIFRADNCNTFYFKVFSISSDNVLEGTFEGDLYQYQNCSYEYFNITDGVFKAPLP
jgi:hypothetical protein